VKNDSESGETRFTFRPLSFAIIRLIYMWKVRRETRDFMDFSLTSLNLDLFLMHINVL